MTGKTVTIIVISIFLIVMAIVVIIAKDKEKSQVKISSEKSFYEQIAVKTAKTWKVLSRDISEKNSFTIYEFVLGSEEERLVVRTRFVAYETSDILPGDNVKVSLRPDYKSEYGEGLSENPYVYAIVRIKKQ
jgi:hypothetical protein